MLGIYVHIPFCDKICKYCDFAKVNSDVMRHERYLKALALEYELYKAEQGLESFTFDTVYFGGGTPSALNETDLESLLSLFAPEIKQASEITFEANPESLTEDKIHLLKQYGVNRVSLGVQTFDENRLRFLNRGHTNSQVEFVLCALRRSGIENINLDLMYALPKQTVAELLNDIQHMIMLNPTHISTYALIFEPHTALYLQLQKAKIHEVDETLQEGMYRLLQEHFEAAGYEQYEFSNWAKRDAWSKHNTKYWDLSEYVGLGLGSHGFYRGIRYANTRSIVNYIDILMQEKRKPIVEAHEVTRKEQMEEMLFLGLRMSVGVGKQKFKDTFGQTIATVFSAAITEHLQKGNLIETPTHYRLTKEALFISNEVLSAFLLD